LRALAGDTTENLLTAVVELGLPWTVELRTGDTSTSVKQRQRHSLPTALVTTPESLTVMLSYPESHALFAHLTTVVVDEWHELLGTKRGVQTELALARLRRWHPNLRVWGLSATLGNLETALDVLVPPLTTIEGDAPSHDARLISADTHKPIHIDTLIPEKSSCPKWWTPSSAPAPPSSLPTRAPKPKFGSKNYWKRIPTSPGKSPCTTVRFNPTCARRSKHGCAMAACAASSVPPA
jgi:ATP-dependent Lhr-like helicase